MIPMLAAILALTSANDVERASPVVFIPGTGGSTLRFADDGRAYWLDERILDRGRLLLGRVDPDPSARPTLVAGEVLDVVSSRGVERLGARVDRWAQDRIPDAARVSVGLSLGFPIYSSFLRWAREEFAAVGFYEAPYDWRLRPESAMAGIDRAVDRARKETGAPQVILVCHSLGGLVGREYVATTGRGKVRALIAVGTPWLGTTLAARAVFLGHDFGLGMDCPSRLPAIGRVPRIRAVVDDRAYGRQRVVRRRPRLSFVRPADARALAGTFPSVFLMMPAREYDDHLSALLGAGSAGWMSPVAEWSSPEFERQVIQANPPLAEWAGRWRKRYLNGESFGVDHVLLGYTCDPGTPDEDWSTVRFSVRTPRGASLSDDLALRLLREAAGRVAGRTRWPIGLDPFVPTDLGPDLGDGTVPLFSATGGGLRRVDEQPDRGRATELLGHKVRLVVGTLSPGKTHMTALDDPGVRASIAAVVEAAHGRPRSAR